MVHWIRKGAFLLASLAFFLVFIVSLDPDKIFDAVIGIQAAIKGGVAFFVFIISGYVLADIVLKGLVETINTNDIPVTQGGLAQHIRDERERMDPESNKKTDVSKKTRRTMNVSKEDRKGEVTNKV